MQVLRHVSKSNRTRLLKRLQRRFVVKDTYSWFVATIVFWQRQDSTRIFLNISEKMVIATVPNTKAAGSIFERFCKGQCKFRDINASLCERFRLYLLRANGLQHNKKKLPKNSASAYFNAFLSIVHFAYRDNILSEDYTACVEKI